MEPYFFGDGAPRPPLKHEGKYPDLGWLNSPKIVQAIDQWFQQIERQLQHNSGLQPEFSENADRQHQEFGGK
jgi:hypothetical protein